MQRITEITNDPSKRKKMAESAIKATEQFHPSRIIAQYMKMYDSIIKKDIVASAPRDVSSKRVKGAVISNT